MRYWRPGWHWRRGHSGGCGGTRWAANELVDIEGHKLVASGALGAVILPSECHAFAVERTEPTVGNGDPVRVARQIGEHRFGSAALRQELRGRLL